MGKPTPCNACGMILLGPCNHPRCWISLTMTDIQYLKRKTINELCDLVQKSEAENGRLREALEEVRPLVVGANRSKERYPKANAALAKGGLPPALQVAQSAIDAAHFLLVWTYQADVHEDPPVGSDGSIKWRVWHLHPGVRGKMNSAEQELYDALTAARKEDE